MRAISLSCLLVCVLAGNFTTVHAQGRGSGKSQSGDRHGGVDVDVGIVFGSGELTLIRAWFGDSHKLKGLPPGLAKRETLPPGLQKHLRKNGTLPPGLEGRIYPVPLDLNRRLPDLRHGLSRVIIGGSILLVDDSSSLILDIAAIF